MIGSIPLLRLLVSPENHIGTREAQQTGSAAKTSSPTQVALSAPASTPASQPPAREERAVPHVSTTDDLASRADHDIEDKQIAQRKSDTGDKSSDIMQTMKVSANDASELASLAKIPDESDDFEGMETISDIPDDGGLISDEFDVEGESDGTPMETMEAVPTGAGLTSDEFGGEAESDEGAMETVEEIPSDRILSEMAGDQSEPTSEKPPDETSGSTRKMKTVSDASEHTVAVNNFLDDNADDADVDDESVGMQTMSDDAVQSLQGEEFDGQPVAPSNSDAESGDRSDAMQTIDSVAISDTTGSEFDSHSSVAEAETSPPSNSESHVSAPSTVGSFGSIGIEELVPPDDVPADGGSSQRNDHSVLDTVDEDSIADASIEHIESNAAEPVSRPKPFEEPQNRSSTPKRLGKFVIGEVIGSGSFGTVYKSRDPELDRDVAIKIPHAGTLDSDEELERFLREGRAAAALRNANICPVHEIGKDGDQHYIVMAFIKGKTLSKHIAKRGKFSERQAAIATRKLAQALRAAHEAGIVHRDLKPANIIIDDAREPVVMDFGLARRENANEAKLTQTGQIMGTPAYMAPEQAAGDIHLVGPATDIYGLGTILYEMLTGCQPFQGSVGEIMSKILTEDPVPVSVHRKGTDENLESICRKAMARQTDDRYATMEELAVDLAAYLVGETPKSFEPKLDPSHSGSPRTGLKNLKLVATAGADAGNIFELSEELILIGRSRLCAITVNDPAVSKIHCRIRISATKAEISDANSSWGTIVNGERITETELRPGDTIKLGATRFLVEDAENIDASDYRSDPDTVHPRQNEATPAPPSAGVDDAPPASSRERDQPSAEASGSSEPNSNSDGNDADAGDAGRAYPRIPPKDNLADLVGTKFIRYEIRAVLARARTGMLFHAYDTKRNRPVALKILWPELSQQREEVRRFIRAIKTMMGVKHESLIALYGAGKTGAYCFTASEYIEGESVSDVIQRIGIAGMLEWQHPFQVMLQIARALEVAYQHQIVHRNISPQNIMIRSSDNLAKLGDLMLAKALEGTLAEKITQPGEIVGDLAYLAPEQTGGTQEEDCRADIYSLGATAYAMLTGQPPLKGNSPAETIKMIRDDVPERPTKFHMSVPAPLEDIVMRMLTKQPGDRYQTPTQLVRELERLPKLLDIAAE